MTTTDDYTPDLITFTATPNVCPLHTAIKRLVNQELGHPREPNINAAVSFLRALITRDHPASTPLADLTGHRGLADNNIAVENAVSAYLREGDEAAYASQLQIIKTARENYHEHLRRDAARVVNTILDNPITVMLLFNSEDLAAFRQENQIPENWYDTSDITTVTTTGTLSWDTPMPGDQEQHVVFYRRDGEGPEAPLTPVAMINLARLLGIASGC